MSALERGYLACTRLPFQRIEGFGLLSDVKGGGVPTFENSDSVLD